MKARWLFVLVISIPMSTAFVVQLYPVEKILALRRSVAGKSTIHMDQSHNHNLDFNESTLPFWATNLQPPRDRVTNDDEENLETLYLGDDDFVSVELENENDAPEIFCATVLYENADDSIHQRYYVEPRMGRIEPNGGVQEVSIIPIINEDFVVDDPNNVPKSKAWLVISTENGHWYYTLLQGRPE